jgi:ABC-type multidrug transport system ATPase subunit
VLDLRGVTVESGSGEGAARLLHSVSLLYPEGRFGAILGPSGCGKSTLLRTVAGLLNPVEGSIHWRGRDVMTEDDLDPGELGYVPQFSIAHDALSVEESVHESMALRVSGLSGAARQERVGAILASVEMAAIADRRVRVLSGGQRRRLALAMELTSNPSLLLCDEVTSGLDPQSEEEIVQLLRRQCSDEGRIVMLVTHSLRHLELFDLVTVLASGRVMFHGPGSMLQGYFQVEQREHLFGLFTQAGTEVWAKHWIEHGPGIMEAIA